MKARLPEKYRNGGGNNVNDMVRKAQKIQEEMKKAQDELELKDFAVSVGGGAVEVVVTGKKELKSLLLQPEVVDPSDIEMLQDLIIGAVNEGLRMVEDASNADVERITGGLSIPGLF